MKLSRRRVAGLGAAAALAVVAGCSRPDGPEDPVWGKVPCAHCRMLVGERLSSAQVFDDGARLYFDDIGCMVLWLEKSRAAPRAWVRSADDGGWIEARHACYVGGRKTPMDFGWQAAASGGEPFDHMRAAVLSRTRGRS